MLSLCRGLRLQRLGIGMHISKHFCTSFVFASRLGNGNVFLHHRAVGFEQSRLIILQKFLALVFGQTNRQPWTNRSRVNMLPFSDV